jgi:hypothetical protein
MRIWAIEEDTKYPSLVMVVAVVYTPAKWRAPKSRAWIAHTGEALRGLFPNLPETIEGPWGKLGRAQVFGSEEACSSILDAMEGLSLAEGARVDAAFKKAGLVLSTESLADRIADGKLSLSELNKSDFSVQSQVGIFELEPEGALYKQEKQAAVEKIDEVLDKMGEELSKWMPSLVQLARADELTKTEVERAMALARRCELDRAAGSAHSRLNRLGRI